MLKYTVEQFQKYCHDKDKSKKIECPICKKLYNFKGLWTHIDRTHNQSQQYCNGNNGCYNKQEYKNKIKQKRNEFINTTLGEFKEFEVTCCKCKKKFKVIERENKFPSKKKYFCSSFCAHSRTITEFQKQKSREWNKANNQKNPEYNICKSCGKQTKSWRCKFCCKECLKKWKQRNLTEYKKYRSDCQFRFSLSDYPNEFDFFLIKENGWYKASNHGNNLNGISRDHMYSVFDGFQNNIDPKIISHPANCKLMIHSENSSKHKKSSITLEELLERIKKWDKKYGARDC